MVSSLSLLSLDHKKQSRWSTSNSTFLKLEGAELVRFNVIKLYYFPENFYPSHQIILYDLKSCQVKCVTSDIHMFSEWRWWLNANWYIWSFFIVIYMVQVYHLWKLAQTTLLSLHPCLQPCIFLKMFLHHFIFIFPRCANERFSAVPDWSLPLPHRAHCEVCWDQMPSRPRHVFCASHTIEVFCQLRGTT